MKIFATIWALVYIVYSVPIPQITGGGILDQIIGAIGVGLGNSGIIIGGIDVGRALAQAATDGAVGAGIGQGLGGQSSGTQSANGLINTDPDPNNQGQAIGLEGRLNGQVTNANSVRLGQDPPTSGSIPTLNLKSLSQSQVELVKDNLQQMMLGTAVGLAKSMIESQENVSQQDYTNTLIKTFESDEYAGLINWAAKQGLA